MVARWVTPSRQALHGHHWSVRKALVYTGRRNKKKREPMSGYTPSERFLSLFTTLRPREGQAALMLCCQAFFIMLAYYMLKVIREPMILAEGAAELKAYTTGMQAVILMLVVPMFGAAYRKVSDRAERYHLIRQVLLFFITNLFAFAGAYLLGWSIAIAFYVGYFIQGSRSNRVNPGLDRSKLARIR